MVFHKFSPADGLVRFKGTKAQISDGKPIRSYFWAAGFSFSYGTLLKDCPYLPDFENVFFGEEHLQSYQMWKKNYQIFSP